MITKLTTSPNGLTIEYLTYDRYPEGYDFRKEREHRIVLDEGVDYLSFDEHDVYMVIVPNAKVRNWIEAFFKQAWKQIPRVEVYPN